MLKRKTTSSKGSTVKRRIRGARTARLEARVPEQIYELVQRAATLQGRTLTDFVVTAAEQAAIDVIEQRETIQLSTEQQDRFIAAILAPRPISAALKRAAAAHRTLVTAT